MDGYLRLRSWLQDHRPGGADGFSLVELLVAVGILGVMAGITLGRVRRIQLDQRLDGQLQGRQDPAAAGRVDVLLAASALRNRDRARQRRAARQPPPTCTTSPWLRRRTRSPRSGRCIGTSTAYNIAAPTVGSTDQSGVTVAVMNPDGTASVGRGRVVLAGQLDDDGNDRRRPAR